MANFSRGFAADIDHAVDNTPTWTQGNPLSGGQVVLCAMSAGLRALFTLDYLTRIPDMPPQPVATPPTPQPPATATPQPPAPSSAR